MHFILNHIPTIVRIANRVEKTLASDGLEKNGDRKEREKNKKIKEKNEKRTRKQKKRTRKTILGSLQNL